MASVSRWLFALGLLTGCHKLFGLVEVDPPSDGPAEGDGHRQCGHLGVAAGRRHTCALDAEGSVWCWGANTEWQAQPDGPDFVLEPAKVLGLPMPAVQIAAGREDSCARLVDGSVWCWGSDTHGQLGQGSMSTRRGVNPVPLGVAATDIDVGAFHACARLEDSTVKCWGNNSQSEVGLGAAGPANVLTPTLVSGSGGAQKVVAGHRFNCLLDAGGGVKCWGKGEYGQLGFGSTDVSTATAAPGVTGVVQLAAGGRSVCTVQNEDAYCWGNNQYGQLGIGSHANKPAPGTRVLGGVRDVGVGSLGACALMLDGGVHCWGVMDPGTGSYGASTLPRPSNVVGAASLAVGFSHVCAVVDGEVQCWGDDTYGQLGRGARALSALPVGVTLPASATAIAVGPGQACALTSANEVYCWGGNAYGTLGIGSHDSMNAPVKVPTGLVNPVGIAMGSYRACAWSTSSARCWGLNEFAELGTGTGGDEETSPQTVAIATGITAIALGTWHTCVMTGTGVRCWGRNHVGQLGNGNTTNFYSSSVAVTTADNAMQLVAGSAFNCARLGSTTVQCWGSNDGGQLGNNSVTNSSVPTYVTASGSTLAGVSDISAGRDAACAVANGTLYCWGHNEKGQLGLGDAVNRDEATPVTLPAPAVDVEMAAYGGCVKLADTRVFCWGAGELGQLASGTLPITESSPIEIAALTASEALRLETGGGCRLKSGAVECWGTSALLGDGDVSRALPGATHLPCP